jgi:2-iminobutanoate/2-iminopropanoate deaminase
MLKQAISAGTQLGPYSSAVVTRNHCYVAGTGGFVPGTSRLVEGGVEAEFRQAMRNLDAVLAQAGFTLADVVSMTCYLSDLAHWPLFNEIFTECFAVDPPARATIAVNEMPAGANIEITCVAWRDDA